MTISAPEKFNANLEPGTELVNDGAVTTRDALQLKLLPLPLAPAG